MTKSRKMGHCGSDVAAFRVLPVREAICLSHLLPGLEGYLRGDKLVLVRMEEQGAVAE